MNLKFPSLTNRTTLLSWAYSCNGPPLSHSFVSKNSPWHQSVWTFSRTHHSDVCHSFHFLWKLLRILWILLRLLQEPLKLVVGITITCVINVKGRLALPCMLGSVLVPLWMLGSVLVPLWLSMFIVLKWKHARNINIWVNICRIKLWVLSKCLFFKYFN